MSDETKSNEYEPTPVECKILEAMLNPENRFISKTKLCELAGVDRTSFYRVFNKPEFVAYYKKKAVDLVDQSVVPIIHTFTKLAIAGSYQHGKAVLDMAKMSADKIEIVAKGLVLTKDVTDIDDPKELSKIYSEMVRGD